MPTTSTSTSTTTTRATSDLTRRGRRKGGGGGEDDDAYAFASTLAERNAKVFCDAMRQQCLVGRLNDDNSDEDDEDASGVGTSSSSSSSRVSVSLAMDGAIADGLVRATPGLVSTLKTKCHVKAFYALEPRGEIPETDASSVVVFACQPRLATMKTVAEHVKGVRDRYEKALRARAAEVVKGKERRGGGSGAGGILSRVASRARRNFGDGGVDSGTESAGEGGSSDVTDVKPMPKMVVMCLPRATALCERALKELHVLDYVTLAACDVHLIPLEPDVFSLEYKEVYAEVVTEEHEACTYYVAAALHQLQRDHTGLAPIVKGKGRIAHEVAKHMFDLRVNGQVECESEHVEPGVDGDPLIDMIVLIDRDVDMTTPLCTQLTYEGLIDEILGIEKGAVAIPQRAFDDCAEEKAAMRKHMETAQEAKAAGKTPTPITPYVRAYAHKAGKIAMRPKLNNTDKLFDQLRDLNFGRACNVIRDLAHSIKEDYNAIKEGNVEDQHVSEIGGFVKKIKANMGGAGLDLHATLAKYLVDCTKKIWFQNRLECERMCVEGQDLQGVMDHIEVMIYRGDPPIPCLRMIVLACICFGGLPTKHFEKTFQDLVNAFGMEIVLKLLALEKAGLFVDREDGKARPRGFAAVRKPLRLVADGVDGAEEPKDITFAFSSSGYAPLSVRLAEAATLGPWRAIAPNNSGEEMLKSLPGDTFEYGQTFDDYDDAELSKASYKEFNKRREKAAPLDGQDELWPKPTVMVFFIGGVTHAEIACLRHLETSKRCGANFVVGTTKIFNGDTLIDTCGEDTERLELRTRQV